VEGLAGRRVLVTGGAGFIGSTLVPTLQAAGADVVVADRVPYRDPDVPTLLGDLTDAQVRDRAVHEGLDGIVHLAAITSVLESVHDPAGVYRTNVEMTAGLLELARERGVPRFLMASTNAVVGDVGDTVIDEDVAPRPLTPYGATKAAAEMLMWSYAGSYQMTTCALRLTNVYGPGMAHKDSFVPRLMRAARSGGGVRVYGDGAQRRDFVHVSDAANGFLVGWCSGHVGPLVIGAGRSHNVLELVAAARTATGADLPIEHVPAKPGEMPAVIVSVARAASLGYRPGYELADGLATAWADFAEAAPADGPEGLVGVGTRGAATAR
jgi:UDP-glucose 4-epimerase